MKPLKVFLLLVFFACANTYAQSETVKIESLPIDKKTNCYIRYFYFPNLQAYYDNLKMVYYFKENDEWKTAPELPKNFGGYSLFNKARVTINNYDDDDPFHLLPIHKKMYPYNSKGRFFNSTANK